MASDLVDELAARPDDVELRRVIADRLQEVGDPRGELIAVQCALAAAATAAMGTPEEGERERERLYAREGALLPRVSLGGALDPAVIELEWRLGFVLAATVLDRARELVPALVAHPAARLIEELTIAAEPEDLAALGAALAARPRPSLLRWVAAGPTVEGRRWVETAEPEWVAPLAAAAPDLAVRPMTHVMQASFEEGIERDTEEYRNELWCVQIAPAVEHGCWEGRMEVRRGSEAAFAKVYATLSEWARNTLIHDPKTGRVDIHHHSDRTYVGYGNLYRAIRALAPFAEDTRFAISESYSDAIDEIAIVRGRVRHLRGFAGDEGRDDKREYWYRRHLDRPCDDDLRRFVARLYADDASFELRYVERLTPADDDPEGHREIARAALDRALALDDRNPDVWQFRGRLARAVGELAEAARCFAREQVLDPSRAKGFDLAITRFASRQDLAARAELERQLAAEPGHAGARLVAAFLAHRAGEPAAARAHLEALVGAWKPQAAYEEQIVQSDRHAELFAWLVAAVAGLADPAHRRGAASYLLAWAEHFRIRVAHDRAPEESARIAEIVYATAAELDPLGGEVHFQWSRFDRRTTRTAGLSPHEELAAYRRARPRSRANLERALAINPDHLEALGELGIVHRELGEPDRAIELLERYRAVFRATRRPEQGRGMYWDLRMGELWRAYYDRAALALFGVPPGANRPPGRPAETALARAEADLDRAHEVLREQSTRERAELVPCYLVKASIAAFRDQHRDALAWADRALAIDDKSAHAWSARASCQNNLGALDDAAVCAGLAIELDVAQWHGHYVLACIEAKRGAAPDAVLRPLARALELWPEGRPEAAGDPDFAAVRELPAFRALVGAVG